MSFVSREGIEIVRTATDGGSNVSGQCRPTRAHGARSVLECTTHAPRRTLHARHCYHGLQPVL
jgi:hypothetical protein